VRNAAFNLTQADVAAVRAAVLDDQQGVIRRDGSP
jgi:hypothetical protein